MTMSNTGTLLPEETGGFERLWAPNGLTVVFQPIVHVCAGIHQLHAVECLTRGPRGTELEQATHLFDSVRHHRREVEVDRLCTGAALATAAVLPSWLSLSLNVHASTLSRDTDFPRALALHAAAAGIVPSRVTVELVESSAPDDDAAFARALRDLRAMGFRLAIDDVGLGHSNLKLFVDVRPDYVKIDRFFVAGVEDDAYRHAILRSIADLGRNVGALVVAEGVESKRTLDAVIDARICLIQGHLLARPLPLGELLEHPLVRNPHPGSQRAFGVP
jgi:EAL domain-containing protein (putative c-di-GMP-specific phosphodiesterase class I)